MRLLKAFTAVSALLGATVAAAPAFRRADEFDTLRTKAIEMITGGSIDASDADYAAALAKVDTAAAGFINTMDTSASRTLLWTDLPVAGLTVSANFVNTLDRLQSIAIAYSTAGTSQYKNATLGEMVVKGMRFVHDVGFKADAPVETDNWWSWEIGGPRRLMVTCMLLLDIVPAEDLALHIATVDRWCPDADYRVKNKILETGANRSDKALNILYRGIAGKNADKMAQARDSLSDKTHNGANTLFTYVTSGDGFYVDGSLVQHTSIAYTGTYGEVLLKGLSVFVGLLGGSSWEVTDPNIEVVLKAVQNAFEPFMLDGLMMDTVRGRAVSRRLELDKHDGIFVIADVLVLAQGAPEPYRSQYKALVKGWIDRSGGQKAYYAQSPVVRIALAKALYADASIAAAPQTVKAYVFADMDRVVQRRPDWSFAVSLSSKRIAPIEWGNGENVRGWYQGDGMTYMYTKDMAQFNDQFWPSVDPYRLPGTTVDNRTRADLDFAGFKPYLSPQTWSGGAVLDDKIIASGMILQSQVGVMAKKSWFILENAVVALGSGVKGSGGYNVETIIENRNLHDTKPKFQIGDKWALLEGVASYAFLEKTEVKTLQAPHSGTWRAINNGAGTDTPDDKAVQTREYLTMWVDHGVNGAAASTYGYVILPGGSKEAAKEWTTKGYADVVNTDAVSGVFVPSLGVTMANFWTAGEGLGLKCDGAASVVLKKEGNKLGIAVSDPSRTVDTLRCTLPYRVASVVSADASVQVQGQDISVKVGGTTGHVQLASVVLG